MARFPLSFIPSLSYKGGRRYFGAPRGGRKHAGVDLIAKDGTPIYAVADGEVIRGPYEFYHGAYAIEVLHPKLESRYPGMIVRYCEIGPNAERRGRSVTEGQVIGHVKKMWKDSMLHFEMYLGTETGRLTIKNKAPYNRRADIIDPTPYLDVWAMKINLGKMMEEPWVEGLMATGASTIRALQAIQAAGERLLTR